MSRTDIKILIVEDEKMSLGVLATFLRSLGYKNIYIVDDGVRATKKIRESLKAGECFDLVLSDYKMPIMDGFQLFAWIKEQPELDDMKFIMVSAFQNPSLMKNLKKAGISGYLLKPVQVSVLQEKLNSLFPDMI